MSKSSANKAKTSGTRTTERGSKQKEATSPDRAKTRLLLALWVLAGEKSGVSVSKGSLPDWTKGQDAGKYEEFLQDLQSKNAIALEKNRYEKISLLNEGVSLLLQGLQSFEFESQIGAKTANAVLRLMQQKNESIDRVETNGNGVKAGTIGSYDEFKSTALEIYDRLNRDYNLDNLVPIYRIRREIGERVSRSEFNEWLLDMQANDIFQLQGGSVEDSAADKIEDSITTKVSGLRCYVKRLA